MADQVRGKKKVVTLPFPVAAPPISPPGSGGIILCGCARCGGATSGKGCPSSPTQRATGRTWARNSFSNFLLKCPVDSFSNFLLNLLPVSISATFCCFGFPARFTSATFCTPGPVGNWCNFLPQFLTPGGDAENRGGFAFSGMQEIWAKSAFSGAQKCSHFVPSRATRSQGLMAVRPPAVRPPDFRGKNPRGAENAQKRNFPRGSLPLHSPPPCDASEAILRRPRGILRFRVRVLARPCRFY